MNKKHKHTAKPLEEKKGKGKQKDLNKYNPLPVKLPRCKSLKVRRKLSKSMQDLDMIGCAHHLYCL